MERERDIAQLCDIEDVCDQLTSDDDATGGGECNTSHSTIMHLSDRSRNVAGRQNQSDHVAGFDVLTYFKGSWAGSVGEAFDTVDFTAPAGTTHTYDLAERLIDLPGLPPNRRRAGRETGIQCATACVITWRWCTPASMFSSVARRWRARRVA